MYRGVSLFVFFADSAAADAGNLLTNRQGFYTISAEYYNRRGDYPRALAYLDSLTVQLRPGGVTSQLVAISANKAKILERMGRYKEACGVYNEVVGLRDSLSSHRYAEKVGELEVQYGLDKAERDKALLLAQKRQNSLYFALTILLLAVIAVVYLWRNLLRIKHLQHNLSVESQRAQESERLKRDFMGSMSHEIRTPLNAIHGFAQLIELEAQEHAERREETGLRTEDRSHRYPGDGRHAADGRCVALVAGLEQQQGIGTHERYGHGDPGAIGKAEVAVDAEFLDAAEDVVPAAGVEAGAVVAQFVEDFVHLEGGRQGLDQRQEVVGRRIADGRVQAAAPLGLRERVRHVWLHEGREVDRIALHINGGREAGYRAWTRKQRFPTDAAGRWQVKVLTDSTFTKARILSIDDARIRKDLKDGNVVVVAGFQGADEEGNITTLGRGGSDTSAVALAAALKADECQIYTDVDGVYTTDPRIEPKARRLKKIAFEEMLEMASLGAKVLQVRSVELAMVHKVRTFVRSSFEDPDAPGMGDLLNPPGTLICDEDEIVEQEVVTGIAYAKDEAQISLRRVADRPGVSAARKSTPSGLPSRQPASRAWTCVDHFLRIRYS